MAQVINHLNAGGQGEADPSAETGAADVTDATAAPVATTHTHYTANLVEGTWMLMAWQGCENSGSAALPEPGNEHGIAYAWCGEGEGINCEEYIVAHASDGSTAALVPGVAARPTLLPGMTAPSQGPESVDSWLLQCLVLPCLTWQAQLRLPQWTRTSLPHSHIVVIAVYMVSCSGRTISVITSQKRRCRRLLSWTRQRINTPSTTWVSKLIFPRVVGLGRLCATRKPMSGW